MKKNSSSKALPRLILLACAALILIVLVVFLYFQSSASSSNSNTSDKGLQGVDAISYISYGVKTIDIDEIGKKLISSEESQANPEESKEDKVDEEDESSPQNSNEGYESENVQSGSSTENTEATVDTSVSETTAIEPEPEAEPEIPADTTFVTDNGFVAVTQGGITTIDGTIIANKTYSLPPTYDPGGILPDAWSAWLSMSEDAAAEGINLFINSGYRSYYTQERIYNGYVYEHGQAEADTYSARPGHSEHQTGLTLDLNSFERDFGSTPEGLWLDQNSYKYGYVIRYPQGKQHITGYIPEPWHFRYVGPSLAEVLYNGGNWISLEEYFGVSSVYQ